MGCKCYSKNQDIFDNEYYEDFQEFLKREIKKTNLKTNKLAFGRLDSKNNKNLLDPGINITQMVDKNNNTFDFNETKAFIYYSKLESLLIDFLNKINLQIMIYNKILFYQTNNSYDESVNKTFIMVLSAGIINNFFQILFHHHFFN